MGFKNQIWVRFFGSRRHVRDSQAGEQPTEESKTEPAVMTEVPLPSHDSGTELKLPQEHALHKLCDMRMQRSGGISHPRLWLEGREDFTQGELQTELGRLQKTVTQAADSRLKEIISREEKERERQLQSQEPDAESEDRKQVEMDALPLVHIAADKLAAWIMVFPPIGEGKELNQEQLDTALRTSGVAYGVDRELLKNLPDNQERYFYLFNVARGKPAQQGKDGYIVERYDRVVDRHLEADEHDRVDYTSVHFFQSVEKGDVICEAVQPTPGDPGRTVLDQEIPVRDGKAASIPKGRNTELSEDGTQLLAAKAGHVEYNGKGFQVKSVLDIAENVDYSTGNIKYMGDVHIHGSVCGGFSVCASGNVTVDGVVEGGSVEAGGDIVVARGIVGNTQSMVQAKHSVYAKYLENSTVHARENVQADSIVNSDVYCDGEVQVCSGRGIIVGGKVRAAKKVTAKTVGSRSESHTSVLLGGEPCADCELRELAETVEKYAEELEKLEKRPDSPDKKERMNQVRLDLLVSRGKLQRMEEQRAHDAGDGEEEGQDRCRLVCDIAYPGLTLSIRNTKARLQQETSKCNARLTDGEIRFL